MELAPRMTRGLSRPSAHVPQLERTTASSMADPRAPSHLFSHLAWRSEELAVGEIEPLQIFLWNWARVCGGRGARVNTSSVAVRDLMATGPGSPGEDLGTKRAKRARAGSSPMLPRLSIIRCAIVSINHTACRTPWQAVIGASSNWFRHPGSESALRCAAYTSSCPAPVEHDVCTSHRTPQKGSPLLLSWNEVRWVYAHAHVLHRAGAALVRHITAIQLTYAFLAID